MSRILVVEDEVGDRRADRHQPAPRRLRGRRSPATPSRRRRAVDGVAADLVLLDWMLPGQSRPGAGARAGARDARTRALPIIMLTARADEADKIAGLDAGADDYLTKPFSTNELLARIRAVLRRSAPEALDAAVEVGALALDPATRRVTWQGPRGQGRRRPSSSCCTS